MESNQVDSSNMVAVYGGSFKPPGIHHRKICAALLQHFCKVIIVPCGIRTDKAPSAVSAQHQKDLIKLGFEGLPGIIFDFFDLSTEVFTPTWQLQERYRKQYPRDDLWFVVGGDLVNGGSAGISPIQQQWKKGPELWDQMQFALIDHPGCPVDERDLPCHTYLVSMEAFEGRGTIIRERIRKGFPIDTLVTPLVAEYIYKHKCYNSLEGV